MDERFEPIDVTVTRDTGLKVVFADDHIGEFNLMQLRLACPCAECRAARFDGRDVWPSPSSPLPLSIADAEFHGAWGLAITWNDGHATGIFPFETLRRWSDDGRVTPPVG